MQGTVLAVAVAEGDTVETGSVLCVVEAMKMENEVRAPHGGVVAGLGVAVGEPVASGQVICWCWRTAPPDSYPFATVTQRAARALLPCESKTATWSR